jgi:hypothetical protein
VADRRDGINPLGRGDVEVGANGGGTEKTADSRIRASPI